MSNSTADQAGFCPPMIKNESVQTADVHRVSHSLFIARMVRLFSFTEGMQVSLLHPMDVAV